MRLLSIKNLQFLPSLTTEEKVAALGFKPGTYSMQIQDHNTQAAVVYRRIGFYNLFTISLQSFNMQSLDCSIRVYRSILAILCLMNIFALKISVCLNVTNSNSNIHNIHFTPNTHAHVLTYACSMLIIYCF